MHTDVFVILDSDDRLLLVNDALPEVTHKFHFWQTCEAANRALKAHFGIDAVTVRVLKTEWNGETTRFTYLMDYLKGFPPSGSFVPLEMSSEAQAALNSDGTQHQHRVKWYMREFLPRIEYMMRKQFGAGVRLEQVRSWGRSSIWRVLIESRETQYLKLIPPMFAHEPQFTHGLAQAFPMHMPVVTAFERDEWFVTADYGGESLFAESKRDLGLWERALREYARFQQASHTVATDALIKDGLPRRDITWIAERWRDLLADEAALTRGAQPLDDGARHAIRSALPKIEAALSLLAANQRIAFTHGDFWVGQIIHTGDDRLLFTDWSDAAFAHPFFDLVFFLAEIENDLPHNVDAKNRLIDAYLSEWGVAGERAHYAACEIIAPLYTALRYHHDILPNMEFAWEMENMLTYNLRLMLRALE